MRRKILYIIFISTSLVAIVFVGGRMVIASESEDSGDVLILRQDNSDNLRVFSAGNNKAPLAFIDLAHFAPFIFLISFIAIGIFLFFKILFISVIPIRGPPQNRFTERSPKRRFFVRIKV
jgi:hypothetical protein